MDGALPSYLSPYPSYVSETSQRSPHDCGIQMKIEKLQVCCKTEQKKSCI